MKRFQIILIFVCFFLIFSLGSSVVDLWSRRDILTIRKAKLQELEQKHQELQKQLEEVETPGFVEREARERLGLSRPTETVIILKEGGVKGDVPSSSHTTLTPYWKQWWETFF